MVFGGVSKEIRVMNGRGGWEFENTYKRNRKNESTIVWLQAELLASWTEQRAEIEMENGNDS